MQQIFANAGFITGLFYIITLLCSKGKHQNKWWLIFFLTVLISTFSPMVLQALRFPPPQWINASFGLLWGPALYFYITTLLKDKINAKLTFLHALPFLGFYLASTVFHLDVIPGPPSPHMPSSPEGPFTAKDAFTLVQSVSLLGYSSYTLWMLNRHARNIQNHYSYKDVYLTIRWSYVIIISFVSAYLLVVISEQIVDPQSLFILGDIQLVLVSLFIYTLGYLGIKQQPVFLTMNNSVPEESQSSETSKKEKYSRNKIQPDLKEKYTQQLLSYMSQEQPYLQPKLTLNDLSKGLNIHKHDLSQIINDGLDHSFYSFINSYRVEEVKQRIMDDKNEHFTLLSIALDSGFNSKSGFNQNFKLETGMTPLEYKNKTKRSLSA